MKMTLDNNIFLIQSAQVCNTYPVYRLVDVKSNTVWTIWAPQVPGFSHTTCGPDA